MRKVLLGFVLALALYGTYWLGREVQRNQQLTETAAVYLFGETDVRGPNGSSLTRAQLLDAILADIVAKAQREQE